VRKTIHYPAAKKDQEFQAELDYYLKNYVGKDEMQKLIDEANQTLEAQFQKKEKEILS
jgi:tryptophan synthase beta subunit